MGRQISVSDGSRFSLKLHRWVVYIPFVLLTWSVLSLTENFSPQRTLYIDRTASGSGLTNFLFRGNMPINGSEFAYEELVVTLRKIAEAQQNLTLPEKFVLTDLSYLNPLEFKDENIERKFFESNPIKGTFVNWIIVGNLLSPQGMDAKDIKDRASDLSAWQIDDLPRRMTDLRTLLYTNHSLPNVIYTHCEAGTDRTGEMSGAYYMKYLNMTFQQAMYVNNHVQNRLIYKVSGNALQWYCYYLQYKEGRQGLNCTYPAIPET
eukprot:m.167312 g.167312  ORF g.167312 m.167312 type:complete len:263 (+) comp38929_c1_seq8:251-1039(+)